MHILSSRFRAFFVFPFSYNAKSANDSSIIQQSLNRMTTRTRFRWVYQSYFTFYEKNENCQAHLPNEKKAETIIMYKQENDQKLIFKWIDI